MRPPCSSTILREIDRPRPVPPFLRVLVLSTCWNSSKILRLVGRARCRGRYRPPRSRSGRPPGGRGSRRLPWSVNLMALPTRLSSTWVRRRASPVPVGRPDGTADTSARFLVRASNSVADMHRRHHVGHAVVLDRQRELAGLDLGEIEHVVDQAEQVPAVGLHALQHALRLLAARRRRGRRPSSRCSRGWR